jgi:hypothetical protein
MCALIIAACFQLLDAVFADALAQAYAVLYFIAT